MTVLTIEAWVYAAAYDKYGQLRRQVYATDVTGGGYGSMKALQLPEGEHWG